MDRGYGAGSRVGPITSSGMPSPPTFSGTGEARRVARDHPRPARSHGPLRATRETGTPAFTDTGSVWHLSALWTSGLSVVWSLGPLVLRSSGPLAQRPLIFRSSGPLALWASRVRWPAGPGPRGSPTLRPWPLGLGLLALQPSGRSAPPPAAQALGRRSSRDRSPRDVLSCPPGSWPVKRLGFSVGGRLLWPFSSEDVLSRSRALAPGHGRGRSFRSLSGCCQVNVVIVGNCDKSVHSC